MKILRGAFFVFLYYLLPSITLVILTLLSFCSAFATFSLINLFSILFIETSKHNSNATASLPFCVVIWFLLCAKCSLNLIITVRVTLELEQDVSLLPLFVWLNPCSFAYSCSPLLRLTRTDTKEKLQHQLRALIISLGATDKFQFQINSNVFRLCWGHPVTL